MPGRTSSSGSYRYGFNGKENDNEVKGTGNQQDYGMRVYDPRLGKFLSVDPLSKSYPWNSPYAFAENSPIENIDLDGAERFNFRLAFNSAGQLSTRLQNQTDIIERVTVIDQDGRSRIETRINQRQEFTLNNRRTNFATIDRFNNRQGSTAIVNAGLTKIENDFKRFDGNFPENYYEEFGRFLINSRIDQLKPSSKHEAAAISNGFNQVKNLLDNESNFNNGEGAPLFHAFENVVRHNDKMGYDKLLHFTFSAQHAYNEGSKVSFGLGVLKEFFKDEIPSWFSNDIGWDDNDMRANNRGIEFGKEWRKYFTENFGINKLQNRKSENKSTDN